MNEEIKAQWVSALRSGEYEKGRGVLHRVRRDESGTEIATFCCLGVLCDLAYKAGVVDRQLVTASTNETVFAYRSLNADEGDVGDRSYLPPDVGEWADIDTHSPEVVFGTGALARTNTLANLNDEEFRQFEPIADLIENQL